MQNLMQISRTTPPGAPMREKEHSMDDHLLSGLVADLLFQYSPEEEAVCRSFLND